MRNSVSALVVAAVAVGAALGQPGGPLLPPPAKEEAPAKSALEEALATALKDNPDLKVAAAKLAEAEAQFHRTRLQVVQKVVSQQRVIDLAEQTAKEADRRFATLRKMHEAAPRSISQEGLATAEQQVAAYRAKLADAKAEMAYLQGKASSKAGASTAREAVLATWLDSDDLTRQKLRAQQEFYARALSRASAASMKGPMADKVRKALDRPINLKFANASAETVLKALQKECPDFHIRTAGKAVAWNEPITVDLKGVPLGAGLQLVEDALGYSIAVREYGLLIAPKDRMPTGAVLLDAFWKGKVAPATPSTGGAPPAKR